MNSFTYNGVSSSTFNILIDRNASYKAAARDYSICEIPGRNGDLTIDNGRYKNVDLTYTCGIGVGFHAKMNDLRAWLMSDFGYHRLEDSFQPDVFRMARVKTPPDPEVFGKAVGGTFDIVFDCKPQRFLKSGEAVQSKTASGSITNPTRYDACPLLRVYGTGTFVIGNTTITILSANSYTDIDCDIQDAFKGTTNCNGNVRLDSGDFPVLKPGSNGITLRSGITRIDITPRWWTI